MSYLVLALKWRPQRFDDVTGQEPISRVLSAGLKSGRTAHAYLFSGPRGVGKTTMARILAKAVNCEEGPGDEPCNTCPACREVTSGRAMDVIEIDGASNRGIDDIRDLREGVRYAPASLRTKVYIIDEVHMLTQDAFNALLKTLEEPPRHVIFVLATTEPLKVPQTILSRCQRFDFARLRGKDAAARLGFICEQESIEAETDALELIARKGDGSMRDALTLFDQVLAAGVRPVTAALVRDILGITGRELLFEWTEAMSAGDPGTALRSLSRALDAGASLLELGEEFLLHLRNLLLVATDPELSDLLEVTAEERAEYARQAASHTPQDLLRACRLVMDALAAMRRSGCPRVHLEVALAELCVLPSALDLRRFIQATRGRLESSTGETGAVAAKAPRSRPQAIEADPGDPWQALVEEVAGEKPALAAFLLGSTLVGQEGQTLLVEVPGFTPFHRETLERAENRRLVLRAVARRFGDGLTPSFRAAGAATGSAERPAASPSAAAQGGAGGTSADSQAIRRIVDLFDGDVLGPA